MTEFSRRQVLTGLAVLGISVADVRRGPRLHAQAPAPDPALTWPPAVTGIGPAYPTHDPSLAKEIVGVAHRDLGRVKTLVSRQPNLAEAAWDWGFGDWETALGAASHVGNRPIAEYLLDNGAPPTIFSATMLGHLDVVKAMIAAQPGLQKKRGPHGIPLLAHARAGGAAAARVLAWLETLGGADDRVASQPITAEQRATLVGRYVFGAGPRDAFDIANIREQVEITRIGAGAAVLVHLGDFTFAPAGGEHVRVKFLRAGATVTALTVGDPDVTLTATRR